MNMRIETLRGLACLLLVTYHVIGADQSLGLRIGEGPLRWINDGLAYLRMPLFTFLSGLVYGLRPFSGSSGAFLTGKARRLLIPMLFVGTLFAVLQAMVPGTNGPASPWYLLHLQPVGHFWFVESLFWVFLLIWALERFGPLQQAQGFLIVFALSCVLYLSVRGVSWLGIEGAIYLLPYFLAGLACSRFPIRPLLNSPLVKLGLAALAVGSVVWMGLPVPNPDRRTAAMLVAGVTLCLLSLSFGVVNNGLARLGSHAYPIYIFHVFFTASSRIGLNLLGIDSLLLDILAGVIFGLLGPILVERMVSPFKWPALLMLGKSVPVRSRPASFGGSSAVAR